MKTGYSRRQYLAALASATALGTVKAATDSSGGKVTAAQTSPGAAADPGFAPFQVPKGQKQFGHLNVVDCVATRIDMPVGVIHGTSEGPTVVVTGGLFPTEYAGVEAAARLYQTIHPSDLAGRLVVVPVVNMPCLQFRTPWFNLTRSISPMDGLSINSVFPGDPQGRVTQVVAHTLLHEIVLKGNYHVDLRGGDLNESHLVHTIFPKIGQEIDGTCEELAKVIGFEYVMPGTPDISHTSKSRLVYETVTRGVPSVITECGLGYRTQPREQEIVPHVEGVKNVLKHLGMMAGAPTRPRSQQYLDMSWQRARAEVSGIFQAGADAGDLIERGQVIGRITDLDGSELSTVVSPISGVVHTMFPRRVVYPGDTLYLLLRIAGPTGV